jgi:hypothetical protein
LKCGSNKLAQGLCVCVCFCLIRYIIISRQ